MEAVNAVHKIKYIRDYLTTLAAEFEPPSELEVKDEMLVLLAEVESGTTAYALMVIGSTPDLNHNTPPDPEPETEAPVGDPEPTPESNPPVGEPEAGENDGVAGQSTPEPETGQDSGSGTPPVRDADTIPPADTDTEGGPGEG